jgi:hypothetical protein
MKKLISIILISVTLLSCGGKKNEDNTSNESKNSKSTEAEQNA